MIHYTRATSADDIALFPIYTTKGTGDMQVYKKNIRFKQGENVWDSNSWRSMLNTFSQSESWCNTATIELEFNNGLSESDFKSYTWSSSKPGVASIVGNGKSATITRNKKGSTIIKVVAEKNSGDTYEYYKYLTIDKLALTSGSGSGSGSTTSNEAELNYNTTSLNPDFATTYGYGSGNQPSVYDNDKEEWKTGTISKNTFDVDIKDWFNNKGEGFDNLYKVLNNNWTSVSLPDNNVYELTGVTWIQNFNILLTFTRKATSGGNEGGSTTPSDPDLATDTETSAPKPCDLIEQDGQWVNMEFDSSRQTIDKYYSANTSQNNDQPKNESYDCTREMLIRSVTVNVEMPGYTGRFGMYTQFGVNGNYSKVFSLAKYNTNEESFSASYEHPKSGRIFFSFEDWLSDGDKDLNDVVFLISNINNIKGTHDIIVEEEESESEFQWLVAAEDLGSTDDFDFNDVVFGINSITTNWTQTKTYTENDKEVGKEVTRTMNRKITVQALAAGGTLKTYLHYNDGKKDYILGPNNTWYNKTDNLSGTSGLSIEDFEWHRWFGSTSYSMINTGISTQKNPGSCVFYNQTTTTVDSYGTTTGTPSTETTDGTPIDVRGMLVVDGNFTVDQYSKSERNGNITGFYITVNTSDIGSTMDEIGDNRTISHPRPGAAPQMFLIPDDGGNGKPWYWPTERSHILDAYGQFGDWVKPGSSDTNKRWHTQPTNQSKTIRPVFDSKKSTNNQSTSAPKRNIRLKR